MKLVANALIVLGFCLATLGAAGFHEPRPAAADEGDAEAGEAAQPAAASARPEDVAAEPADRAPARTTERFAWPFFGSGIAVFLAGWMLQRSLARKVAAAAEGPGGGGIAAECRGFLDAIRARVRELDAEKQQLSGEELRARIDALLKHEVFDLTSRHEALAAAIGFRAYAEIWSGVADAERNLARAWSMATDGHLEEALVPLGHARIAIEAAGREMEQLGGRGA